MTTSKRPLIDRVMSKVDTTQDCWLWTGALRNGYGVVGLGSRTDGVGYVHRVSYEHFVGPIPDGLHIDHLCRVRACCNPEHLQAVTQGENNQRMWNSNTRDACRRGHRYVEGSYRQTPKQKTCLVCVRENYAKKRAAA